MVVPADQPVLRRIGSTQVGASRTSRLGSPTSLLHADLHNHTLLSDGRGDPERAFASMRSCRPLATKRANQGSSRST